MEAQTTDPTDIVFRFLGWLHAHRKPVITCTVIVAVVGIGAGLYSWKQGQNDVDANAALLSLPIGSDMRVHAAGDKLEQLAASYPSTSSGEYAALLSGENFFVNGKYVEAGRAFSKFIEDYPISSLLPQANLGVAASLEAQNKIPEAAQQYQKVIQTFPTELAVVEPAKLTLGRLDEDQNRLDQAFTQYRDLAQSPNPNDLWAAEAKERLQLLVGNHPELLKQMMGSTASQPALVPPKTAAAPTLSAGPAATLSAAPAGSNAAPAAH